ATPLPGRITIWRYTLAATPALDTSFNGVGYILQSATIAGSSDTATFALLDSLGRIVVSGYVQTATDTYAVVWRFLSSGAPDTPFGGGTGYVAYTGTAGATVSRVDQGLSVRIDSTGRYVMAGTSKDSAGNTRMAVWRIE